MNRFVTPLAALALFAASVGQAMAASLVVTVKNVRSDTGAIYVSLYSGDSTFMRPNLATVTQKVAATQGEVKVTFKNLRVGRYAVVSFHDENDNGQLDASTEGVGFSKEPAGEPKFMHSAFIFDGSRDMKLEVSLKYP